MCATFDGTDLTYAELGGGGYVFQAPILFDPEEFDAVAEAFAEAILSSTAEAEGFDGIGESGSELCEAERLGEVVEGLSLECSAHVVERGVSGDDDDAEGGPAGEELIKNLLALEVAHFHV